MRRSSTSDFVNYQVKLLIKRYPNRTIKELMGIAEQEYPKFSWNRDKIRNAIERLYKYNNIIKKETVEHDGRQKRIKIRLMMLLVNYKSILM